jgi:DNA-binding response OmpR family regulator
MSDPRHTGESRGSEMILVVEDEEMLADLVQSILERKGYRVIVAGDEEEAVQQFMLHRGEISVVLSDRRLPRGSGTSVLGRIRRIDGQAKVILISGAPGEDTAADLKKAGAAGLLMKPLPPAELVRAIREVIDSPPPVGDQ